MHAFLSAIHLLQLQKPLIVEWPKEQRRGLKFETVLWALTPVFVHWGFFTGFHSPPFHVPHFLMPPPALCMSNPRYSPSAAYCTLLFFSSHFSPQRNPAYTAVVLHISAMCEHIVYTTLTILFNPFFTWFRWTSFHHSAWLMPSSCAFV